MPRREENFPVGLESATPSIQTEAPRLSTSHVFDIPDAHGATHFAVLLADGSEMASWGIVPVQGFFEAAKPIPASTHTAHDVRP